MREIKFRGKSMGGHWYYGLLTKKKIRNGDGMMYAIAQGNYSQGNTIPVMEESVGEYTGMTDKNNVEIYEGDILKTISGLTLEVEYRDGEWCLKGLNKRFTASQACICEVVGNVSDRLGDSNDRN